MVENAQLKIGKVEITVSAHLSDGRIVDQKLTLNSVYEVQLHIAMEAIKYIFTNVMKRAKELTK